MSRPSLRDHGDRGRHYLPQAINLLLQRAAWILLLERRLHQLDPPPADLEDAFMDAENRAMKRLLA